MMRQLGGIVRRPSSSLSRRKHDAPESNPIANLDVKRSGGTGEAGRPSAGPIAKGIDPLTAKAGSVKLVEHSIAKQVAVLGYGDATSSIIRGFVIPFILVKTAG